MIQNLIDAITDFFGNGWITTFVVAMIPLIELKGAIPVGSISIGVVPAFVMAYLGSFAVFFPLFFVLKPLLNLLKRWRAFRTFACKVERLFVNKAEKIAKKTEEAGDRARRIMMWGTFGFVAVPLPMTGVWTGTAVAVFLGLSFWEALLPVAVGNLVAGLLIALLTYVAGPYVDWVILALAVAAVILLVVFFVKVARTKLDE